MKKIFFYLTLFIALFFGTNNACQAQSSETEHSTSLTLSPIHLLFPVLEVTGEFAMQPKVGVAVIGGIGSYEGYSIFELGGQFNYYLLGDFDHGMQIGPELMYVHISDEVEDVSLAANGLSLAGYLGYKVAASYGLTFNAQLGGGIVLATAHAEDSVGNSGSGEAGGFALLLNLNIGWSF